MPDPKLERLAVRPDTSLADQVISAVRSAIREENLVPGVLYSVYWLAERFGVSRSPVREALLRLGEAGAIQFERNRGFRVQVPDPRDVAEIFAVRMSLEVPAAGKLAFLLTSSGVARLDDKMSLMKAAAESGDEDRLFLADQQLHDQIMVQAGNGRAAGVVRSLRETIRLIGVSTTQAGRTLTEIEQEHRPIVEALRQHDRDRAEGAMRSHLTATALLLISQLQSADGPSMDPSELWDRVTAE